MNSKPKNKALTDATAISRSLEKLGVGGLIGVIAILAVAVSALPYLIRMLP